MFVAINNVEMNIFQLDEWIKRNRDENGGLISSEFAMEVLSKTNHFANIKMLMKNINKLPDEEKKKYKDFVLACVDRREQTPETMEMLRSLADVCGVREEFDEVNKKSKFYDEHELGKTVIVKSVDEFKNRRYGDLRNVTDLKICFDCDEVSSYGCDFGNIVELRFVEGAEVSLGEAKNLPKGLDVSMCSKVDLRFADLCNVDKLSFAEGAEVQLECATNLPSSLDVSKCSKVNLSGCDLSNVGELRFAEGAKVDLHLAKNLPSKMDVSKCSNVKLSWCDLGNVEELNFREGADIDLYTVTNLPKVLDVSMCSKVNLFNCDLSNIDELKFAEGAEVDLSYGKNLPSKLDVSKCFMVDLGHCDLSGVRDLKFYEGAEVFLYGATNLPEVLDVSMCSKVNLYRCDLSKVSELKFKDKRQKNMVLKSVEGFNGKISYEGDDAKKNNVWYSKLQDFLGKRRM